MISFERTTRRSESKKLSRGVPKCKLDIGTVRDLVESTVPPVTKRILEDHLEADIGKPPPRSIVVEGTVGISCPEKYHDQRGASHPDDLFKYRNSGGLGELGKENLTLTTASKTGGGKIKLRNPQHLTSKLWLAAIGGHHAPRTTGGNSNTNHEGELAVNTPWIITRGLPKKSSSCLHGGVGTLETPPTNDGYNPLIQ